MNGIKYLPSGTEVRVAQTLDDGRFLVEVIYWDPETGQETDYAQPLKVVSTVLDKPPVEKIEASVQKLRDHLARLTDEYKTLRQETQEFDKLHADTLKRHARYKELAKLDDFLDGKITHYVFVDRYGNSNITDKKDTASKYASGYGRKRMLRLLSLFGEADGSLEWAVNNYADGSGSWSKVIPCISYEEALAELRDYINLRILEDEPHKNVVETADRYGIPVPDDYRQAVKNKALGNLRRLLEEAQRKVAGCEASIAEMER